MGRAALRWDGPDISAGDEGDLVAVRGEARLSHGGFCLLGQRSRGYEEEAERDPKRDEAAFKHEG
ncbi:MAG: hypothetical protein NVSMB3_00790 [Acidobacteriaceae bacterium]